MTVSFRTYQLFGIQAEALSVRTDYDAIVEAAKAGNQLTVLCDLQTDINAWTGGGALIYAGSIFQKFNLWIPNRDSPDAQTVLRLIENRYGGQSRSKLCIRFRGSEHVSLKRTGETADCDCGC